jgi:hypothetical protein
MAFKPGFDQSPAFNDAGRNAWGAGSNAQPGAYPQQGYPQQGGYPQAPYGQTGWGQAPHQPGMSPDQLRDMYDRPSADKVDTGRMSYEDTIVKTSVRSPAGTCRRSCGSSARSSGSSSPW